MKTIKDTLQRNFKMYGKKEPIKIANLNDSFDEVSLPCFGSDMFILSNKHIKALKEGKVLLFPENGGEYQMFIKLLKGE